MYNDRQKIINEIKDSINKKKNRLLNQLPVVHSINDGIIIRFFDNWNNSIHNDNIKYIEIVDDKNPDQKTYYFFLPKGSIFDIKKHDNIENIICLEGKVQLHYNQSSQILNSFNRTTIPPHTSHYGIALNNTYLVVSSKY